MPSTRGLSGLLAAALLVSLTPLVVASSVSAGSPASLVVGAVKLHPCDVTAGACCGSIKTGLGPVGSRTRPDHRRLRLRAGARRHADRGSAPSYRTRAAPDTARRAPASSYARMYGPLLERRNLLLVDQRGTGRSEPIDCPDLQDLHGSYAPAAGKCGRSLGIRSDNYSSAESADDLAAVLRALDIRRIDLYGDSLRHVLRPGLRGSPPGPAAQRRTRQRLPDVRRERVVPDADAGDAARVHARVCALAGLCATAGPDSDAAAPRGPGTGARSSRTAA